MRKITILIFLILNSSLIAQTIEETNINRIIVKFKSSVKYETPGNENFFNHKDLDKINEENGIKYIIPTGDKKKGDTYLLIFDSRKDINHIINQYKSINLFEYVEEDFIGTGGGKKATIQATVPNDTHFSRQYGLYNDGTFSLTSATNDADIDMELGWDIETGDQSIIVAVLDAGIKLDHPEFSGRLWVNSNETLNGIDDDNNGYIDDINGWDFANNDKSPADDHGHGTNVTGIIGANSNNNLGYSGVDWNCKLMIAKILDQNNGGYYSWWTDAIYYAVDNGAKIINMSVGGSGYSSTMKAAIDYAYNSGVTVVACMMNENNNLTYYPAGYQNTIAVGSTDPNDERSSPFSWSATSGSNYGSHIDVVAPGSYTYGLDYQSNTNYGNYWGGTSQATPLVAGLSSLLLSQDSSRTPSDIRTIIRNTAEDQVGNSSEDVSGFDIYYGYGRINAYQALLTSGIGLEHHSLKSLILSPNPNTGYFSITVDQNQVGSVYRIIDNLGRLIDKGVITEQNQAFDLSDKPKGVYRIQVSNENMVKTLSVVIQ